MQFFVPECNVQDIIIILIHCILICRYDMSCLLIMLMLVTVIAIKSSSSGVRIGRVNNKRLKLTPESLLRQME